MKKKFAMAGLLGMAFATLSLGVLNTAAQQRELTTDLISTKFVTAQTATQTPSSFSETRVGLLLTGRHDGASAEFKKPFAGAFTLDYRTYADNATAHGLKKLRIHFEATDTKESFFVEVKSIDGKRVYSVGIGEDVFSKIGYGEGVIIGGDGSDLLTFNPNDLSVSVGGTSIWSFATYKNGDYKHDAIFNGFAEYKVRVEFADTAEDGHLLVYALNGQKLDERVLHKNVAAPTIYAATKVNGLVGEEFILPTPQVYDVIDGEIASTQTEYTIWFGAMPVKKGTYSSGASFMPKEAGEYTVAYTAKDSGGLSATLRSTFTVLESEAECSFATDGVVNDLEMGTGGQLYIPRATATSGRANNRDVFVYVDILRDGTPVENATGLVANGFNYTFTQAGDYTVAYRAKFNTVTEETSFKVAVREDLAYLTLAEALPQTVATGARFKVPDGTLTLGENTVSAEKLIIFPSGATYTANYIDLTEYGNYRLVYRAKIGEVVYEQEHWLQCVTSSNEPFTGDAVVEKGEYVRAGDKVEGVVVTQSLGRSGVTFNEPIDLSGKKKGDTLVEMATMPFVEGTRDYHIIYITLTDVNDPDNYVSIKISQQSSAPKNTSSYVKVSHNGQEYVGVESETDETIRIYRGSSHWGYYTSHSFCGGQEIRLKDRMIKFSMDYEKKRVYFTSSYDLANGGLKGDHATIDLSSLSFYSEAWQGFSEDKCYIKIEAAGYSNSTEARYIIKSIGNYDFGGDYLNYSAPNLTVDYAGNEDEIPQGIVGTKYPLFAASATDLYTKQVKVSKNVYMNYGTNRQIEVDVVDGAFTPLLAGDYTIVYRASDGLGNTSVKTVDVPVATSANPFTATVSGEDGTYYTGTAIALATPTYTGNLGNVTVESVTAKCGNDEAVVKDGALVATKAGTYQIKYVVKDYLNRKTEASYSLEIAANPLPVFEQELNLLPIYSVGESYVLPALTSYDYSNATTASETAVTVKAAYGDGHSVTLGADRTFTPEAGHGDKVTVSYTATAATSNQSKTVSAEAYVAAYDKTQRNIKMQDYFVGTNVDIAAKQMQIDATVADNSKPAQFIFARPLLADALILRMEIGITNTETETAHNNAFNALTVTLTDSEDPSLQVKLTIEKKGKTSNLWINDATYSMAGSFWGTDAELGSSNDIQLRYNNKTRQVLDGTGSGVAGIVEDVNGNPFNGFPSGKVYASFAFEGVESEGQATVKLLQLNNQNLNDMTNDVGKPELFVNGVYGGIVDVGTEVTLPTAYAADVLTDIKTIAVTVTGPDNRTINATDGTKLNMADATKENTFKVDAFGMYKVTYTAIDTNNQKTTTVAKIVYVLKDQTPEYTLNGTLPTSVKGGATVEIPTLTTEANYNVILFDGNWTQTVLYSSVKEGEALTIKFVAQRTGEYTVRYYVYDKDYNYVMKDFVIKVVV